MTVPGPHSPRYDWQAIELDYCAGILPLQAICSKHGCSMSRLTVVARQHGWERNPPPDAETLHGLASSGFVPTVASGGYFDEDVLKRAALVTGATVIEIHRKDVAKLRDLASLIVERLGMLLAGQEVPLPFIGGKESPADLLEKLSRVYVRVTQLERQAFNLEAMNPAGGTAKETDDSDALAAIRAELEEITRQKIEAK